MERSKLEFSSQELALLQSQEIWNARRELVDQLSAWFGETLDTLKQLHQTEFEKVIPSQSLNGKITRGDNHHGFPYLLLDYPNHFSKDEIVAARNLIWFGNGFHCTLHVRGALVDSVVTNLKSLSASNNIHICMNKHEWIHDINNKDWIQVNAIDKKLTEQLLQQRWIKLGIEIPIAKPDEWKNALVDVYETWISILKP